jgi:hypothetical protein
MELKIVLTGLTFLTLILSWVFRFDASRSGKTPELKAFYIDMARGLNISGIAIGVLVVLIYIMEVLWK